VPKTLLHLDSSPMGDRSISRHLSAEFARNWQLVNPDGLVITRDTTTSDIPAVTAEWAGANYTLEPARDTEQRELLALSETLVAELITADEYVIGVPIHNFMVPSTLKLWIDQVARVGKTFSYATGSPVGLLKEKKATIIIASGGNYDASSAMASYNFTEPYLRWVLAFMGVTDTTFISAGGAGALARGGDRDAFLRPHIESIRAQFATV
jgi:FMN-dependent NADH-azoreductase